MLEIQYHMVFFNGGRFKMGTSLQRLPDITLVHYYYLGQLAVTTKMVVKKITAIKDNKSHGVNGILPSLLMETVQLISNNIYSH